MKMKLSHQTLQDNTQKIIAGIMNRDNQAVFTSRGGKHYMDNWDWFQGVALFGMYEYYRDTKDQAVLDYLIDWFDTHIAEGGVDKNVNSMAPLLTLSYLYEITGKESYLALCEEWADYALNDLPRTEEGGFQHVTIDSDNYMQLWDDTLYMLVLFLGRMGKLLGRDDYVQESIRQFLVHLKYLTDPATGLFYHGFNFDGRHHYAGALWGRGNAWYTAGLVDYLDMVDLPEGVQMFLTGSLETQIKALEKYQDKSGMWHTLINDPDSYLEASATAGFGYGILKAVRKGYLPKQYASMGMKALKAISTRIDEKGILQDVSGGTCLRDTLDYYRNIRISAQPYGQSMALLLFMEAMKWEQLD